MHNYDNASPADTNHNNDVSSKGGNPHEGSSEDTETSDGDALHSAHAKACALVKLAEAGEVDEKFSKDWVKDKIAVADKSLTAIHDFIVHDKEATDTNEHGDDGGEGGDMNGGFIISIERALK